MGKAKVNIPMCAALVLLLLTMISIHLTSGLYARYTATATGSDGARVAKFEVDTALDNKDILLNCTATDASGVYDITVENKSEVAIKYKLIVQLTPRTENAQITLVGTDISAYMVDQKGTDGKFYFTANDQVNFSYEMEFTRDTPLMPGAKREHGLKLEVSEWNGITGKVTGAEAIDWTFDVTVTVKAEQVD